MYGRIRGTQETRAQANGVVAFGSVDLRGSRAAVGLGERLDTRAPGHRSRATGSRPTHTIGRHTYGRLMGRVASTVGLLPTVYAQRLRWNGARKARQTRRYARPVMPCYGYGDTRQCLGLGMGMGMGVGLGLEHTPGPMGRGIGPFHTHQISSAQSYHVSTGQPSPAARSLSFPAPGPGLASGGIPRVDVASFKGGAIGHS
jgi:hypothetical protein